MLSTIVLAVTYVHCPSRGLWPVAQSNRHIPNRDFAPCASLTAQIETSLRQRFDAESIERVLQSWRRMPAGEVYQAPVEGKTADPMLLQQANSHIEGLSVSLFHDAQSYEWVKELEANAHVVADEFHRVMRPEVDLERRGNNVWVGLADVRDSSTASYGPEWRTLGLQDRGVWDPVNTRLFPETTALLLNSRTPCVEAFFAKMGAKSEIKPHSDGCNFHLTCHLGVDVPEGQCWLKVGDQVHEWENGKAALFDTSVLHSAVNNAPVDRYVLMLRVWHPELSTAEVSALDWIFKCLDDPDLTLAPAAPSTTARAAQVPSQGAAPVVAGGRKARRNAAKAAKKRAKGRGSAGFG